MLLQHQAALEGAEKQREEAERNLPLFFAQEKPPGVEFPFYLTDLGETIADACGVLSPS